MRRFGRYIEDFDTTDPVTRWIAFAALLVLIVAMLPRIWPPSFSEVNCNYLSTPALGGDHQSLLASTTPASDLRLDMQFDRDTINVGDALGITVRFVNSSMAPLTLYLEESKIPFRYTGREIGLTFFVQQLGANDVPGRTLGEDQSVRPLVLAPPTYSPDQLRILGPRQRCREYVEVSAQRLSLSGMGAGRYMIIAYYSNQTKGAVPPVPPPTPTPIFTDQGVWTGEVRSNDLILNVVLPGQPTPRP